GERFLEAELHRLEGELRRVVGDPAGADPVARTPEACFRTALEIARRQGARELERRAAASLEALGMGAWHSGLGERPALC
ncbi:MAG: hypothetical protein ACRELW_13725, partial [Candidatus Rokuibacteriota bacterium]